MSKPTEKSFETWLTYDLVSFFRNLGYKIHLDSVSQVKEKILPLDTVYGFGSRDNSYIVCFGLQFKRPQQSWWPHSATWKLDLQQLEEIKKSSHFIYYCLPWGTWEDNPDYPIVNIKFQLSFSVFVNASNILSGTTKITRSPILTPPVPIDLSFLDWDIQKAITLNYYYDVSTSRIIHKDLEDKLFAEFDEYEEDEVDKKGKDIRKDICISKEDIDKYIVFQLSKVDCLKGPASFCFMGYQKERNKPYILTVDYWSVFYEKLVYDTKRVPMSCIDRFHPNNPTDPYPGGAGIIIPVSAESRENFATFQDHLSSRLGAVLESPALAAAIDPVSRVMAAVII